MVRWVVLLLCVLTFAAPSSAATERQWLAGVATVKWSGPAWLDASIDVPADGPITVSGDFVAAGAWTREFPAPVVGSAGAPQRAAAAAAR